MCKEGACKRKTYWVSSLAQLHLQRAELLKAAHFHPFVWQSNAQKCKKMHRSWSPSIFWRKDLGFDTYELDKFIGPIIARGILGQRGLPVESLWDTTWVCKVFKKLLSSCIFKEIMRFLRFHMKRDGDKGWYMTNFAWLRCCGIFLLKTFRWYLCLVLT